MKKLLIFSTAALAMMSFAACNNAGDGDADGSDTATLVTDETMMTDTSSMMATTTTTESYVDLSTGRPVHRDEASGRYVGDDNSPVDYYVNVSTRDTFYGQTGQSTSNAMMHDEKSGKWSYDKTKVQVQRDGDIKMKDGDTKVKIDKDGDMKIKDENGKTKIDADDGNVKNRN